MIGRVLYNAEKQAEITYVRRARPESCPGCNRDHEAGCPHLIGITIAMPDHARYPAPRAGLRRMVVGDTGPWRDPSGEWHHALRPGHWYIYDVPARGRTES